MPGQLSLFKGKKQRGTAAPAPRIMPHKRWRGGSVMHAIAITTALSPDRMMLTPMICSAAIQNGACVMSCHKKSTSSPSFVAIRPSAGGTCPLRGVAAATPNLQGRPEP